MRADTMMLLLFLDLVFSELFAIFDASEKGKLLSGRCTPDIKSVSDVNLNI